MIFCPTESLKTHVPEIFGVAKAKDAGDRSNDDHVAPERERSGGRQPEHLDLGIDGGVLLDILVFCRNIGLRLVVIVIRDKIFDPVVREKITEFLVELGSKRLVMGEHQRRPVPARDDICHRERLT